VTGPVEMMRQGRVMDPEPHPDVEAIKPEVGLYCPG